ncbi:helix-turn-helix domain-containing protein [Brevibacillus massiliensis]|uniref:helix-turn-helix domain-containing protein n=1 Tax=Brevibacillus massiliensis TaxID=1118054 RepID=UPI00036F6C45|nr:helix-turn-helix transcriptional regulator [Brevibacillus massiliensis]
MSTFGERLSKLRTEKKLSQAELASRLNIAKSTLAMYETNKREPSFETVERIADFFDVKVDYLLGRTNDPTPPDEKKEPGEFESIFFYELDKLGEEDKQKALEHIRFLRYLAEQENKKK